MKFAKLLASVNSDLDKARVQESELEAARRDAAQANAQAENLASLLAILNSERSQQSPDPFKLNEQLPTLYTGTPDIPALATAHVKVGNIFLARGDLAEALNSYREGLIVADRLAKAGPDGVEWQHKITLIFIKVGDVLMAQGNFAEAVKSYQDALSVAHRFAESNSESVAWQRSLSLAYSKVGDALAARGNLAEALKSLQDGLAVRERVAKASSRDTEAQHDLAIGRAQVATVLAEQGDTSQALELLQQARVIIAKLLEQSPSDPQLSNDVVTIDNKIAKLEQISAARAEAAQPEKADR
jgi:tetratricopeptide (TPR) repeat protein